MSTLLEGRCCRQVAHQFERDRREMQTGQARWDAAEAAVDGRHGPVGEVSDRVAMRPQREIAPRRAPTQTVSRSAVNPNRYRFPVRRNFFA